MSMVPAWRRPILFENSPRNRFVYRYYDEWGRLLYVGKTFDPEGRWRLHQERSPWAKDVVRARVSGPYGEQRAKVIERDAIETEYPMHNVMFTRAWHLHPENVRRRKAFSSRYWRQQGRAIGVNRTSP